MPVITLKTVVLPAPFGPITEKISPASIFKLTWLTAVSPPNCIVSLLTSRMAMLIPSQPGPVSRLMLFLLRLCRGQEPCRPEPHHHDEGEPEDHEPPVAERQ